MVKIQEIQMDMLEEISKKGNYITSLLFVKSSGLLPNNVKS